MPRLWRSVAPMEFSDFKEKGKEFADLLRVGDLHCSNAKPSLKMEGNPVMVNMTFHGMKMLNTLWEQTSCQVPPLKVPVRDGVVLLEVMPGAALRAFELPDKSYKGGDTAFENRRKILRGLRGVADVKIINLPDFHEECMFSDDALDSMVAAIAAAKWATDESESTFIRPSKCHTVADAFSKYKGKRKISPGIDQLTQDEAARKEGWIYVPKR